MNWNELNEARRKLGLTIDQMAAFLGVSSSAYKRWKTTPNGVPTVISNAMEGYLLIPDVNKLIEERLHATISKPE